MGKMEMDEIGQGRVSYKCLVRTDLQRWFKVNERRLLAETGRKCNGIGRVRRIRRESVAMALASMVGRPPPAASPYL